MGKSCLIRVSKRDGRQKPVERRGKSALLRSQADHLSLSTGTAAITASRSVGAPGAVSTIPLTQAVLQRVLLRWPPDWLASPYHNPGD